MKSIDELENDPSNNLVCGLWDKVYDEKDGEQLQRKCQKIKEELEQMSYVTTADEIIRYVKQEVDFDATIKCDGLIGSPSIFIYFKNKITMIIPMEATSWSQVHNYPMIVKGRKTFMSNVSDYVEDFLKTPFGYRRQPDKYRVRLKGFKSDNGPQYLSCDNKSQRLHGKVFACALNSQVVQVFTAKEIKGLAEKAARWEYDWLSELLSNKDNWEPYGGD